VGVDNRLTADQLSALMPGDTVTIESGAEFSRRKYRSGQVVRLDPSYVVVKASGPRGGTFIERYSLRDGVRVGGVNRAELVNTDSSGLVPPEARRRTQHIDTLYREWTRNRTDVDRLRRLHTAISECLETQAQAAVQ
jgi:ribosome maturation factor RimP